VAESVGESDPPRVCAQGKGRFAAGRSENGVRARIHHCRVLVGGVYNVFFFVFFSFVS
jgi:hypothetical protein